MGAYVHPMPRPPTTKPHEVGGDAVAPPADEDASKETPTPAAETDK